MNDTINERIDKLDNELHNMYRNIYIYIITLIFIFPIYIYLVINRII
jgi:hypothetical protein